jgi:GT2 family glycosyltransferase
VETLRHPLAYVIPVLNCVEYTRQAIASIQFGTYDKLIVIDNGSTDGTEAEMRASRDVSVYIRHEKNTGVAASWNEGLRMAFELGYELVLVMNNDVVLAPDTVPALLRWQQKTGGIVSAHSVAALHALTIVDRREVFGPPCDWSCFMISKSIVDKVGWFDEAYFPAYFEDMDYDCRAEQAGIQRGHAGDAVVCHFHSRTLHGGHIENHEKFFEANRRRFIDRWGSFIQGGRNASRV